MRGEQQYKKIVSGTEAFGTVIFSLDRLEVRL
jgi:hypothetical protein